jgi:hypothetical protein
MNTPAVSSRSIGALDSSPGVAIVTRLVAGRTTHAAAERARPAWASASGLPRVASRSAR